MKEFIIVYIMSIIELLMSLIYYKIIFKSKLKGFLWKYSILSIILSTIFMFFIEVDINYMMLRCFDFLLVVLLVSKIEKKEILLSAIEIGIGQVVNIMPEILAMVILNIIFNNKFNNNSIIFFTVAIICFIIFGLFLKVISKKYLNNIENYINDNKVIWILIINILLFLLFIVISVEDAFTFKNIYFEYTILFIMLIAINIYYYKKLFKELQLKKELEVNAEYKYVIDELLDKFRSNEHEFKNHINTLKAIVELENNNNLSKNIDKYIENTIKSDIYSKLMYIDNTIIKAVIYNNIKQCNDRQIKFEYKVLGQFKDLKILDSDLSIILNNILNNAIEAVWELSEKNINLIIKETDKVEIIVENTINKKMKFNPRDMFREKNSTKGKNRGYGLYNVKKIVEKYRGTIQLSKIENRLVIEIIF